MSHARIGNLIGAAALAVVDELRAVLPAEREAAAVVLVGQYPGDTVEALARRLRLTHSGAVRLVDRLETAGLLARGTGADRRRVALTLTPVGEREAAEALARRGRILAPLAADLTAAERETVERVLERWLTALTPDLDTADRICRLCDTVACPEATCPVERAR